MASPNLEADNVVEERPPTQEELKGISEAIMSLERGEGIPFEDVFREFEEEEFWNRISP